MTYNERDAIEAARASLALVGDGDWAPQDTHLARMCDLADSLVAALSAATTERDEALAQVGAATTILAEAEKILPGVITTAGRFSIGLNGRERAIAAEERAEALAAQLQQAREALRGLLDAAEAEVGPKLGDPGKNAEYWAALDPAKHVPGVARRVALARAVIVARAVLAAAAPATTLNEPEGEA